MLYLYQTLKSTSVLSSYNFVCYWITLKTLGAIPRCDKILTFFQIDALPWPCPTVRFPKACLGTIADPKLIIIAFAACRKSTKGKSSFFTIVESVVYGSPWHQESELSGQRGKHRLEVLVIWAITLFSSFCGLFILHAYGTHTQHSLASIYVSIGNIYTHQE